MNLKNGDIVRVEGKESVIETSWGAGAHRAFKLKDGRTVLDLTEANLVKPVFQEVMTKVLKDVKPTSIVAGPVQEAKFTLPKIIKKD